MVMGCSLITPEDLAEDKKFGLDSNVTSENALSEHKAYIGISFVNQCLK